jgi:hypothetical protein
MENYGVNFCIIQISVMLHRLIAMNKPQIYSPPHKKASERERERGKKCY